MQPSADPTLSRACLARSETRIRVRMRCCVLNKSNVRAVPLSFAIPADSSSSGSASSPLSSTSTGRCAAPVSVPRVSRQGCPFRQTQSCRCQAAVTRLALKIVCRCTPCHRNCERMCSCTNDRRSEKTGLHCARRLGGKQYRRADRWCHHVVLGSLSRRLGPLLHQPGPRRPPG